MEFASSYALITPTTAEAANDFVVDDSQLDDMAAHAVPSPRASFSSAAQRPSTFPASNIAPQIAQHINRMPVRAVPSPQLKKRKQYRRNVDTNIARVVLDDLRNDTAIATGDAQQCCHCKAALNCFSAVYDHKGVLVRGEAPSAAQSVSQIETGSDQLQKECATATVDAAGTLKQTEVRSAVAAAQSSAATPTREARADADTSCATGEVSSSPSRPPPEDRLEEGQYLWTCEFCGTKNVLTLHVEEIPTAEKVNYILEAAPESVETAAAKDSADANLDDSRLVVFVIDLSGSMGSFAANGICRLEAVKNALLKIVKSTNEKTPNRPIGLVTFGTNVTISGDCSGVPQNLPAEATTTLQMDQFMKIGEHYTCEAPVAVMHQKLSERISSMYVRGSTALGPAVATAVGMASQRPGSRIIVCTDGFANIGIGAIAQGNGSEEFYTTMGSIAATKGVSIDVIGFNGAGCAMELLTGLAEATNGDVTIVEAAALSADMTAMASRATIATHTSVRILLHHALTFRRDAVRVEGDDVDDEEEVDVKPWELRKDIGSVREGTQLTFEFGLGPHGDLAGLRSRSKLPFQVQIHYTSLSGAKLLRVITAALRTTSSRAEAEKSVNVEVMATHAQQQTANLAREGLYEESYTNIGSFAHYMVNTPAIRASPTFGAFQAMNSHIQGSIQSAVSVERQQAVSFAGMNKGMKKKGRSEQRSITNDNWSAKLYNWSKKS